MKDGHVDDRRFQNYSYSNRKLPSWFKREFETDNESAEERKMIPIKKSYNSARTLVDPEQSRTI